MVNDIEPSILLSIAIIAIVIGSIAIFITIITINNNKEEIQNDQCNFVCADIVQITSNSNCIKDLNNNCSNFIKGDLTLTNNDNDIITVILSPQPKPPLEACRNFCNNIVTVDSNGDPVCPDVECIKTDCTGDDCKNMDCNYYACLNTIIKPPECSSSQAKPLACYNNILYYLYGYIDNSVLKLCTCT